MMSGQAGAVGQNGVFEPQRMAWKITAVAQHN